MESSFRCSNGKLEKIWKAGVRTVEMCTVEAGETEEAWKVSEDGTMVLGQHWAPCSYGTRWGDLSARFEVKVQSGGASWGVHMVANGVIFCLDKEKQSLAAFEGLSDSGGIFPTTSLGSWGIPADVNLNDWIMVGIKAQGARMDIQLNGQDVAHLEDLNIHPILGGSANNTGSIALGGPSHYAATYRQFVVKDLDGHILYQNDLLPANKARTMADFAVGTNEFACTIDGAKRDRACFAGDLFVMGRSIFYSTGHIEAVLGSIQLLSSHQTTEGYMGNLCPIQAPAHHPGAGEPPTYAFYSLGYALALVVATKEYMMHSGDLAIVKKLWGPFKKLLAFTSRFQDERGLVVAPPPLSMDWFPMGGPIFGASGKINLAFYDALQSMSQMSGHVGFEDIYSVLANVLKDSIIKHLWIEETGILRMSDLVIPTGICQDIHAYGLISGVIPVNSKAVKLLAAPGTGTLPLAFQNIEKWDRIKVVSPYASGFAAEALFSRSEGTAAIELIERVWGTMVDSSNPNYSGGLWEAMTQDGMPVSDDCSLMHGWSTWPVFLLPQYLAGLKPLEPGWLRWKVQPVLANLDFVDFELLTPAGKVTVSLRINESNGTGEITVKVPRGTVAEIAPPNGWGLVVSTDNQEVVNLPLKVITGDDKEVTIALCKTTQIVPKGGRSKMETSAQKAKTVETSSYDSDSGGKGIEDKTPNILKRFLRRMVMMFCK